jgi:hypothetical protein
MRVSISRSEPFLTQPRPFRALRALAPLTALIMATAALPVHAQSGKPADRVPTLPAAIAIDNEGVARDAREGCRQDVSLLTR